MLCTTPTMLGTTRTMLGTTPTMLCTTPTMLGTTPTMLGTTSARHRATGRTETGTQQARELRVAEGDVRGVGVRQGRDAVAQRGQALVDDLRLVQSPAFGAGLGDPLGPRQIDDLQVWGWYLAR